MNLERFARAVVVSSTLAVCSPLTGAGVITVDDTGGSDFVTIQAAVNAAVDGDMIVLRPGFYAGFDIVDKSLTVASDGILPLSAYTVATRTAVRNLSAGKTVVLSRVYLRGTNVNVSFDDGGSALFVDQCAGAVRVTASTLSGAYGTSSHVSGYPALLAIGSQNVEVTGCAAYGGFGYGVSCAVDFSIFGYAGGQALRQSGSTVVVHDSTLIGGNGGDVCVNGGAGGIAVANISGSVLLSGCSVTGGKGGNADDFFGPSGLDPGDGGAAVFVAVGHTVSVIDSILAGGAGGKTIWGAAGGFGAPGPIASGPGSLNALGFAGRSLTVTPVARDNATTTIAIEAPVGDMALLFLSPNAGSLLAGPELVPLALGTLIGPYSLGAIPGSGSNVIPIANPMLPPGVEGVGLHLQVVTSGPSGFALTGPAHLVLLSALL